jgi:hypothetical protein
VSFGPGNPGTGGKVSSATSVTVTSPADTTGPVDVAVTTPNGTSASSPADQFSYEPVPTVTAVAADAGPVSGGTSVDITGTGFIAGATSVSFGTGHAASVTVNSPTSLTVKSPSASAGTVDVTVTTAGGSSFTGTADQFTYDPLPTITSISPSAGPITGGTEVTITGTNFVAGETSVALGTKVVSSATVASTTITLTTPASASSGAVDVRVTTPGGRSPTSSNDLFTYVRLPIVTGLSPNGGPPAGGSTVTIRGSDLNGATSVVFGSAPAKSFKVVSSTEIAAVSPKQRGGAVQVAVTTPLGTSATSTATAFTYAAAPAVADSPASPVTTTQALLWASINPRGLGVTRCQFEYGRTSRYGRRIACTLSGTGSPIQAAAVVKGLAPHTVYHFRVVASTNGGTSATGDRRLTTQSASAVPPLSVGWTMQRGSRGSGSLGRLVGLSRIAGAMAGESITVTCARACSPHLLLTIPVFMKPVAPVNLGRPISLTASTSIQITASAPGRLSRQMRYAFARVASGVTLRLVNSGCVSSAGRAVRCPA